VNQAGVRSDAPNRRRGLVAEHAAGGQGRGHLIAQRGGERADLVDAAMQPHQPPASHAVRDRARSEASGGELRGRHHPVLTSRQAGDRLVARVHFAHFAHSCGARWTFGSYGVHFAHVAKTAKTKSTKCSLGHTPSRRRGPELTPSMPPLKTKAAQNRDKRRTRTDRRVNRTAPAGVLA